MLPVIIILAIVAIVTNRPTVNLAVGAVAPDFRTTTPSGEEIRLSDFRGKVVLLNFWATWCGPCRIEMPLFQNLYARYGEEGITIVAVNNRETAQQIVGFTDQLGITFPLALDESGTIQDLYNVSGYPITYIIDADGVIMERHFGVFSPRNINALLDKLALTGTE